MPRSVEHSPRARADLLEIWLYIAADNEAAADRLLERIGKVFDMLAGQPHAGRLRPELRVPELRSFPIGNYVVFYLPSPDTVNIVRVLEGHRDVMAVIERDETGQS